MTVLPISQPLGLVASLLGVVLLSLWLTDRSPWARKFSPVLWILLFAALLTNFGILARDAPLYGTVAGNAVPFAVCLLLFKVQLAEIRSAGRAMGAAFLLAALGTASGVVLAGVITRPWLATMLGDQSWKIAGPFTGTYVGGSLNFFALWDGLEIGEPDLLAAANAVDNLTILPLLAIWTLAPVWLAGRFPVARLWQVDPGADPGRSASGVADESAGKGVEDRSVALRINHVVALVFLAVSILWISSLLATWLEPILPGVPQILIVTTLALAAGQWSVVRRLEGAWELGNLTFYCFFAVVGAMIDVYRAVVLSPVLFVYVSIVVAGHMLVVYGGGRLLRMDLGVLTVASITTKAGPPLVLALAGQLGWKKLVLPGVIAGLLGYAVGNYFGFAVAHLVRILT